WCPARGPGAPPRWWSCARRGRGPATSGSTHFPPCATCSRATMSLPSTATATASMRSEAVHSVIRAYDDWIVRAYCWGRFGILRQRFLDEIGQYLPERGRVLDVGCGFGLFSLYYASVRSGLTLEGLDRNPRRIAMARAAARSEEHTSELQS